jgi:cytoskeletal protein CcmA (bactofilin family)
MSPMMSTHSTPTSTNSDSSTLNEHLCIEGALKYSGTVVVHCSLRGSIETSDRLVIGPTANVQAQVVAGSIEISGRIEGSILAKSTVKIRSGAHVIGDIETPTISMEEGVMFEGRCTRPAEPQHVVEPSSAPADSNAVTPSKPLVEKRAAVRPTQS